MEGSGSSGSGSETVKIITHQETDTHPNPEHCSHRTSRTMLQCCILYTVYLKHHRPYEKKGTVAAAAYPNESGHMYYVNSIEFHRRNIRHPCLIIL
jgi:hypothetical protein